MSDMNNQDNQNPSKWEPDTDKYNTQPEKKPEKPKKAKWWIPVAIGVFLLIAAIVVGGIFGIRALTNLVESGKLEEIQEEQGDDYFIGDVISGLIEEETPEAAEPGANVIIGTIPEVVVRAGTVVTDVSAIVEQAMPSVVSITSRTLVNAGGFDGFGGFGGFGGAFEEFFRQFYGGAYEDSQPSDPQEKKEVESGLGSGTIVGMTDEELLILTSYHVVEDCSSLYVTFCDESAVDGYVKSTDSVHDIAIVALPIGDIEEETLDNISIAVMSQDDVRVGEGVIVIGNALGYGQSVVTGVVSAKDRTFSSEDREMTVIQTDAAINQGNSGGCMLNAKGEIIGISEAKISSTSVEGVCYAISIHTYYDEILDMMSRTVNEEYEDEDIESATGAYLGIYGRDIDSNLARTYGLTEGIYILNTVKGGGAEEAGLEEGDIIIGFDGKVVGTMAELQEELTKYSAGDEVTVTIMRYTGNGYREKDIDVVLTPVIS